VSPTPRTSRRRLARRVRRHPTSPGSGQTGIRGQFRASGPLAPPGARRLPAGPCRR
jgi:hypothetical protein